MASKFKKFINSFSGDDDYYDDDEFYDDEDDFDEEEESSKLGGFFRKKSSKDYDDYDDDYEEDYVEKKPSKAAKSSKITSINNRKGGFDAMDVRIIKPSNFDMDTHDIADNLLEQRTVILNLEGIDVGLAQRIIDFSFGACYALHGNFRAITKSILLITPSNVNISGVLDKVNESINISED